MTINTDWGINRYHQPPHPCQEGWQVFTPEQVWQVRWQGMMRAMCQYWLRGDASQLQSRLLESPALYQPRVATEQELDARVQQREQDRLEATRAETS